MSIESRIGPGTGVNGPTADAVAQALDAQFDALEAAVAGFVAELQKILPVSDDTPSRIALRVLGWQLGVAEDPAWTDTEFAFAIRTRAASRASHGTLPEMIRLAETFSPLGLGTADGSPVFVRLYVAGGLDLSTADRATVVREALLAIPDVAGLGIVATTIAGSANVFTFDTGPGFDIGELAGSLYP